MTARRRRTISMVALGIVGAVLGAGAVGFVQSHATAVRGTTVSQTLDRVGGTTRTSTSVRAATTPDQPAEPPTGAVTVRS